MEQQFFDRENVAEVNEMQLVSHERLYQIEPTQPQELETINEIQTETENEQQLRKPIVNECIAETMLQGSLQVVHDVSREEVALLLLENRNLHANRVKMMFQEIEMHWTSVLEHQLKPSVDGEEQHCSQIQNQVNNNDIILSKLKEVSQDIERKYAVLHKQLENLQSDYDSKQMKFKTLVDKKKTLLLTEQHKINSWKYNAETACVELLKKLSVLEDGLKLRFEQKNVKFERNRAIKDQIEERNVDVELKKRELDEESENGKAFFSQLTALNAELQCIPNQKQVLLDKTNEVKMNAIKADTLKQRLKALKSQIKLKKETICKKKNNKVDLSSLRKRLDEIKKENEYLRIHICDYDQKIKEIEEMFCVLQKLKQESYCNIAEKLKQEKLLFVETTNLTAFETKYHTVHKQLEKEIKLLESFKHKIKECQEKLKLEKQQFEAEVVELTKCFSKHNIDIEQKCNHKDNMKNKFESSKIEHEQQIQLKLAEIDKLKTENELTKQDIDKTISIVDAKVRLRDKLEKEKASSENEYAIMYSNIFGGNSASYESSVRGILKSPKKVKFLGFNSDVSSTQSASQATTTTEKLNTTLASRLPNRKRKNPWESDSS